jgi:hypothetical protein
MREVEVESSTLLVLVVFSGYLSVRLQIRHICAILKLVRGKLSAIDRGGESGLKSLVSVCARCLYALDHVCVQQSRTAARIPLNY